MEQVYFCESGRSAKEVVGEGNGYLHEDRGLQEEFCLKGATCVRRTTVNWGLPEPS